MRKGLLVAVLILTSVKLCLAQYQYANQASLLPKSFKLALKNTNLEPASPLVGCAVCCDFEAFYEDCHDFEDFTLGNLIPQGNPKFTLFPNATQGAQVVLSPTDITNQCIILFNDANIDYNINQGIGEGQPTRLEWEMLIPTDKSGEWGLEVEPNSLYRYVVRYNSGMATVFSQGANNTLNVLKSFSYSDTTWFKHAIIFKPSTDSIELWLNKTKIVTIGGFTNNKISQLNFYGVPGAGQNEFYVDNLCFRIGANNVSGCPQVNDPVCVNGVEYKNSCLASAAGYACEFTLGPCSPNPIGCSAFTSPDNLSTGIDPRVNIKWTQAVGATSYRLLLGTTPGGSDVLNINVGNVLGYSITLQNFTTYYAKVIPTNGSNINNTCPGITFETGAIMSCNVCCSYSSSFADCFNFENFSVGNLITQVSPSFTLYSPTSENAFIVNTPVLQGARSLKGENGTNVDYNIDATLGGSQAARAEWNMLIPAGKSGSWALETNAANLYPLGIKFESGIGTVFSRVAGGGDVTLGTISYAPSNWLKIAIIFQPQDDEIELFINNVFVYKVVNYTSNKVAQINFSALLNKNNTEFYIDNLCFRTYDTSKSTNNTSAPVCVNNENFTNLGLAEVKGYSGCEVTSGVCNQKPACPTIITPVQGAVGVAINPTVAWTPVTNAQGYKVTVIADGVTVLYNEVDVQSATSIQLSNLPDNTFICVYVNAYNAAGSSTNCIETCFTTIEVLQVPVCPQITFPFNQSSNISLIPTITWNPGAFALGYRITVTSNNGNTILINNLDVFNVTSYQIGPLPENAQICVKVTPYNNSGLVPNCVQVCFTTLLAVTPPNCTTVTSPAPNAQNVPINTAIVWQPSPSATGYKVHVTANVGTVLYDNVDVGNVTTFSLVGLPNASQICVRIVPYNQSGDRINCQEQCFNTVASSGQVPSCPSVTYPLMDELNVLTAINVEWAASPSATGYKIRLVQENGTVIIDTLDVGNVTSYIASNLPFSTRLCLSIIPYNASGQNLTCTNRCFTTVSPDMIPPCATITYPTVDAINVPTTFVAKWDAAFTAAGYIVRLVQENGTVIVDNQNTTADSILISNLINGANYCLSVFSYNSVGQNLSCTATCFTVTAAPLVPNCPVITYPTEAAVQLPNSFNATWTASANATGYLVSLATQGGVVIADSIDVGPGLIYGFDNLPSDSVFCLSIIPYNAVGINLGCNPVCFSTVATVQLPNCPTITYPVGDSIQVPTAFNVTWTAASTATGYIVSLITGSGSVLIDSIDIGNVLTYALDSLPVDSLLCFSIIPYNQAGSNLDCSATCFTITSAVELPVCAVVTYPLQDELNVLTSIIATWETSPTATGYILRLTQANGNIIINNVNLGNVTSYEIDSLANGTRFCLTVIPYNAAGQNLNCASTCFTTVSEVGLPTCVTITNPIVNAIDVSTSFTATWSASPAATGYILRLEEENGAVVINDLDVSNVTSFAINNLDNSKRFCIKVTPYNAVGQNLTCIASCFTTVANKNLPTCPMITSPSANETNVSTSFLAKWNSSPAALGYLLRLEEENGPVIINNLNLGNLNAYRFNNLPNDKRLCISIYPYNSFGQNLACTKLCFTTAITSATDDVSFDKISIYPNPTNSKVIINAGSFDLDKISLISIDGAIKIDFNEPTSELDLSNLPSGVYLIKLYSGSRMTVKRVVKVD